jgi:flagellin-like hook-associated protein FlgL
MHLTTATLSLINGRVTKFIMVEAILLMAVLASPGLLSAGGLSGNLSLSSHGTETIAVNGTNIDFDFTGTDAGTPPIVTSGTVDGNGDTGLFDITGASTGSYAGITGTTVTVHDLDSTMEPVGSTTGSALPLTNFITFTAEPGWNITLTEILPGADSSACDGSTAYCTPAGSPFNLQNEAGGQVLVGFAFMGTETDGAGDVSAVAGTFSTTFSNTNYQTILADLKASDAIVSSANATIGVTPIPEPATIYQLLLGCGVLMGSIAYRRRQQRR